MKKLFTLLGIMLCLAGLVSAQDCGFKVKFEVIPASCYNNGKVAYALLDANGNPISDASAYGLEDIRIYFKVNAHDSASYGDYYAGGWDTLVIDYGNYIIGVEAACRKSNGNYIKLDTHKVMTVPTTYVTPTLESFYNMATDTLAYGNRPSLECVNTGRVQLVIKDGKFPYYVTIMDYTTGDTLRTDTFLTRQYSGTNANQYNYKDYYSIDKLPPGNWVFAFEDGCEYGHPYHTHEVEPVEEPELVSIRYSSHSGEYVDSLSKRYISVTVNIDNLAHQFTNTSIKKKYWHNLAYMPQIAEYRINYGEPLGVSEWRPVPSKTYSDYNNSYCYITLYDTLLAKMCKENWSQLLGRPLTLEWRDKCRDTIIYRNFTFSNPSVSYYSSSQTDSTINYPESSNGCVRTTSYYKTYYHTRVHNIYAYNINGKFAHTGVWIWKDLSTGSIIKRDTIAYVSSTSYLYDYEVEELYDWDRKTTLTLNVERVLVSDECDTLFKSTGPITFRADSSQTNSSSNISNWYWYRNDAYCISDRRSITLYGNYYNLSDIDLDSTTIRLVSSPYGNRYNFEAIYSSATKTWEITKSSLDNTATISGGNDGTSLSISDYGLPNGNYNFIVITPCSTYTFNPNVQFSNMLDIEMLEDPEYTIEEECILSYITYTKGRFERHYYQTSPQPDQDYVFLPNKTTTATTFIQIIDGPLGGYDNEVHQLNEPIRISMPGRFIVSIRPYSYHYSGSKYGDCDKYVSYYYCYCNYYDTIYYERNTVEFEYDYAMLCDSNSTIGNVYVKGTNGREPYVYTLYDGPDKTGNIIGTNSTGFFEDVPMTHNAVISCMVRDSCGAFFHVNINPETWTDLQKVWFDNGLTVSTTCEGNTICVNALSIGSILSYEWTGPDGFTDTASRSCVFIPRGGEEGWYKVHIYNTGCTADYIDSIYLHIDRSPSVELADDFTVCPGAPAELKFVPSSPNPTDEFTLKIVLETESGKTTKTLTVPAGDTARYTLVPLTRTKVYVSSIFDGHCEYTIVEDTQFVDVYTINPYTVTTTHDTVCWEITANLSASASLTPPYAIRWYTDYNLTQLVQEDSIFSDGELSSRVLPNMVRDSIFYIMVENNEYCPTTYGMPIHSMNMNNGSTQLSLGNTYRFYDSGGPNANYYTNELLTHTFSSTDGKPVTLKFESFNFSSTSHLYIFTGSSTDQDSLLYDLKRGDANPGTITSRGDALTVYFVSGGSRASGWSAIVEHEPAKAIATVRPKNTITYYDTVCQSQTHTYSDPYHISPDVTSPESLNNALRTYGTYAFSNVLEGAGLYGCDSTVNFYLTVTIPPRHDTTVVITNMHHTGFLWFDSLYTQSGSHIHYTPLEGGCDLMEILYLAVLDIDTLSNDICLGDSTDLIITVKKREIEISERLIPRVPRLGDVLCTDGTTMHPDSFLISGKTAMGVVMSVDAEAGYGRAIALSNAYNSNSLRWAYSYPSSTHSNTITTYYSQAVTDMDGAGNTEKILKSAKDAGGTNTASYAPAAHYCKFYNHNTYGFGTDSLGWYLPAAGEMQLIYGNRVELNKTLTKLRSQSTKNILLSNSNYWTSTEYNNSYSWYLYNTGYLYYYGNKTSSYYARPVIKFPLP